MENNNKLMWVIAILFFVVGCFGGYIVSDKINFKEENNNLINNKEEDKERNDDKVIQDKIEQDNNSKNVTITKGEYKYSFKRGDMNFSVTVNILSDTEMEILSGDGMAVIEQAKGKYVINGDELTFTRIYAVRGTENGDVWYQCDYTTESCGDITDKTEKFIIKDNTLISNDYFIKARELNQKAILEKVN